MELNRIRSRCYHRCRIIFHHRNSGRRIHSPAITLSFAIAAIGCCFAGLCYAEFASMIPVAGSAYTYSYATMGELIAWIIGWDLVLEYTVAATTVSISWSRYLVVFWKEWGSIYPMHLLLVPGTEVL